MKQVLTVRSLKSARESLNMSQAKVVKVAGINRSYLSLLHKTAHMQPGIRPKGPTSILSTGAAGALGQLIKNQRLSRPQETMIGVKSPFAHHCSISFCLMIAYSY